MKLKPEAEKLPPTAPLLAALCRCRLTAAAAGFSGLTFPLFPPTRSQIEQEEKPPAQRNGKSQRQSPSLPPSFSPLSPARDSGFRQKGTHSIDPVPFSCLTSFFFPLFFFISHGIFLYFGIRPRRAISDPSHSLRCSRMSSTWADTPTGQGRSCGSPMIESSTPTTSSLVRSWRGERSGSEHTDPLIVFHESPF